MTIDWFSPWPADALLGVGIRVLEGFGLANSTHTSATAATASTASSLTGAAAGAAAAGATASTSGFEGMVTRVARICVGMHKGVEAASEQLFQEQKRRWVEGESPCCWLHAMQSFRMIG
jgi:hypothetical protein